MYQLKDPLMSFTQDINTEKNNMLTELNRVQKDNRTMLYDYKQVLEANEVSLKLHQEQQSPTNAYKESKLTLITPGLSPCMTRPVTTDAKYRPLQIH